MDINNKMVEEKIKKQLEELAKKDLGVRIHLKELSIPVNVCDRPEALELIQFLPSRKIYYYCNNSFCDKCPKENIPSLGYRKIFAIYENNKLHILKKL